MNQDPGYFQKLPRKRMASGVVFLNTEGDILLVKPTYKDHWEVPGGIVELDESPRQAAIREIKEELNLEITDVRFLCIDYASKSGVKDESLQFIFYGGELSDSDFSKILLEPSELSECKFIPLHTAKELVKNTHFRTSFPERLEQCILAIRNGATIYLEDGELV